MENQSKINSKNYSDLPASTEISEKLSKDLKKRGFSFVGPTICYALMQAIGMVNDHTVECFCIQNNFILFIILMRRNINVL